MPFEFILVQYIDLIDQNISCGSLYTSSCPTEYSNFLRYFLFRPFSVMGVLPVPFSLVNYVQ